MTKDDIIRMAREAGIDAESDTLCRYEGWVEPLERFAALVAAAEREHSIAQNVPEIEKINEHINALEEAVAAEREACAKVCESDAVLTYDPVATADKCAAAIRARSNP